MATTIHNLVGWKTSRSVGGDYGVYELVIDHSKIGLLINRAARSKNGRTSYGNGALVVRLIKPTSQAKP